MISNKDPLQIVVIKGFGSGIGSFVIALVLGEHFSNWGYIVCALLLGFVAYGLSIFFYIYAQRYLGAAKTSAYYALAPFIGACFIPFYLQRNTNRLLCCRPAYYDRRHLSCVNRYKQIKADM